MDRRGLEETNHVFDGKPYAQRHPEPFGMVWLLPYLYFTTYGRTNALWVITQNVDYLPLSWPTLDMAENYRYPLGL